MQDRHVGVGISREGSSSPENSGPTYFQMMQRLDLGKLAQVMSKKNIPGGTALLRRFGKYFKEDIKIAETPVEAKKHEYLTPDYLSVYQDQKIGYYDDFGNDGTLFGLKGFSYDDCDISWSYRQQKYVIACADWVKLVNTDGTVYSTYSLSGDRGIILSYQWQWNREVYCLQTGLKTITYLDHNLNLISSSAAAGNLNIWYSDPQSAGWIIPIFRIESYCWVNESTILELVYRSSWYYVNQYLADPITATWVCPGYWILPGEDYDHGYGEPVGAAQDSYSWQMTDDFPFIILAIDLRLRNFNTNVCETIYSFPMVSYSKTNDKALYTLRDIHEVYPNWEFRRNYWTPGTLTKTIQTIGDRQTVAFFDDGKFITQEDDVPSDDALFVVANSGHQDSSPVIPPSVKVFNLSGTLVKELTLPSTGTDKRISVGYPHKFPVLQGVTGNYPGWYSFAQRYPAFALVTNTESAEVTYSRSVWNKMSIINRAVNGMYGRREDSGSEYWDFISVSGSGDCEDFALEKAKQLLLKGIPASAIHIETGTQRGKWVAGQPSHAYLVVQTTKDDYVLDVLYTEVLTYRKAQYLYDNRARQTGMYWNYVEYTAE